MKMIFGLFLLASVSTKADLAFDLLKASDRARGGIGSGMQWETTVISVENEQTSERDFVVKAKDNSAHVEALKPAKYKGEVYIFNDRNMWFYKPTLKKPVSISARQKLSGQAANGDIASTNYARDYTATFDKKEIIDNKTVHVLLLKAKSKNLTYDKIKYWIEEKSKLAIKAEFQTLQGVPFKIGILKYGEKIKVGGEFVPFVSELTITDAKYPKNYSIIKYRQPQFKSISDSTFNINNLTR